MGRKRSLAAASQAQQDKWSGRVYLGYRRFSTYPQYAIPEAKPEILKQTNVARFARITGIVHPVGYYDEEKRLEGHFYGYVRDLKHKTVVPTILPDDGSMPVIVDEVQCVSLALVAERITPPVHEYIPLAVIAQKVVKLPATVAGEDIAA